MTRRTNMQRTIQHNSDVAQLFFGLETVYPNSETQHRLRKTPFFWPYCKGKGQPLQVATRVPAGAQQFLPSNALPTLGEALLAPGEPGLVPHSRRIFRPNHTHALVAASPQGVGVPIEYHHHDSRVGH